MVQGKTREAWKEDEKRGCTNTRERMLQSDQGRKRIPRKVIGKQGKEEGNGFLMNGLLITTDTTRSSGRARFSRPRSGRRLRHRSSPAPGTDAGTGGASGSRNHARTCGTTRRARIRHIICIHPARSLAEFARSETEGREIDALESEDVCEDEEWSGDEIKDPVPDHLSCGGYYVCAFAAGPSDWVEHGHEDDEDTACLHFGTS